MILINLLPHREAARKRKREAFFVSLGVSAIAGGLIAGAVFLWYKTQIDNQKNRNTQLETEIKRLDGQIAEIANLQTEIAALKARQAAVENLQADRNMPVNVMNELVKQLPDGVYINRLAQRDNTVLDFAGVAQSNERVAELLGNLTRSEWLSKPELGDITGATMAVTARDQRRVANFSMRASIRKPSDPLPAAMLAAMGASSAAASASAPLPGTSGTLPGASAPKMPASGSAPAASGAAK